MTPGTDWLADRRAEGATDRILDAADRLFADHDPTSVGMREIARTAGCSRATLYRYFENREALLTAYANRWANALYRQMTVNLAGIDDPHDRLIEGITRSIGLVRQKPALASWFSKTGPPIGGEMAEQSPVVTAMVSAYVVSLGPADADTVQRRARWVVRVMMSLLTFPGRDAADERAMLEDFVAPVVVPTGWWAGRAAPPNRPGR